MNHDSTKRPRLVSHYDRYLVDQNISEFIRCVSASYSVGSLERLARSGDRIARQGAILALGRLGDFRSNMTMGRALVDTDRGVRMLAESGILRLWNRIGTPQQRRQLLAMSECLDAKEYDRAAQLSTALIEDAPWIAQGWYYRGKAFFQLGQHKAATRDCHQALEINAYHFQAASIMGQSYFLLENPVAALESFRRALRLNPNMEEVRAQVIHLQRLMKDR